MDILAKFKIETPYASRHQIEQNILDWLGQEVIWEYDDTINRAFCHVLLSLDTDFNQNVETLGLSILNVLGSNATCTYVETLDLPLNGPSNINRIGMTGVEEEIINITQTISVPEGNGTRTYTFLTSMNADTGEVISTSTNSTYRDRYVEEITTTSTNQETGETTSTTTTTNSQTGDETTSTTTYDENGTMTGSSTHTDYGDGGSYDSEQTYNDNGTIASDSNTTTNHDGSSESHSTNYDNNGNPTDGENQWVDTSGNENTQEIEYNDDGEPYVTGYDIDTTNNPNGGETLTNPIDTGVMAFDGRDFDIHLKAKFNWSNLQYNSGTTQRINPILNLSGNDINNKVNGFLILWLTNMSGSNYYNFNGSQLTSQYCTVMRVNKYLNDVANFVYNVQYPPGNNKSTGSLGLPKNSTGTQILVFEIQSRSNVFTIEVYNESGTKIGILTRQKSSPYTHEDINFGSSTFENVTVELGHWDSVNDGVQYSFVYEVLEFNVTKL